MSDRRETRAMKRARRAVLIGTAALLLLPRLHVSRAQDAASSEEASLPVGRYITLESPITDDTIAWVKQTALELQQIAVQENRPASLILELRPGTSQFHHVYALADFLTSSAVPNVRTIAWVPETVVGHNAIVALACSEIVMHPDAQLGDIGLGKPLSADQQQFIRNMVAKRRNTKVNEFLAVALMDPQATLVQLTVSPQPGVSEKRLVTEQEAERVLRSGVEINDRKTIKEPGTPGLFSGASARNYDILVVRTANERFELADHYGLPGESLREQQRPADATTVTLIEVQGAIEPVLETFLVRQIDRAESAGARTIIFNITSPGGLLYPSRDLAFYIAALEEKNIRTVAFIPDHAFSGAAFIAMGCDEIYMTPEAQIGDILLIATQPGGAFERVPEKQIGPLREWLADIAEKTGRPPEVAPALVDPELEIFQATDKRSGSVTYLSQEQIVANPDRWVKGPMVPESRKGLPLTVDATRAHELRIAETPVTGFEELKERVGVPAEVNLVAIGRTWIDDFVFFLNDSWVMGFLFFVGIVCIYLELHFMTGLLGIISAVCFGLFFWSNLLGGTAGWLEVVLFMLGIGCLAMEIFVVPGFGVFGVSGGLLILGALIMASQTFGNLESGRDLESAKNTMITLSVSVLAVVVMAVALSRFLPSIPLLNQMILSPPGAADLPDLDEPLLRPELTDSAPGSELVGSLGTARSVLRPAGKAQIDGKLRDVVSEGPFLPEGTTVEVVRISGNRIVVRQV